MGYNFYETCNEFLLLISAYNKLNETEREVKLFSLKGTAKTELVACNFYF